jgi:hypothetical protein
MLVWNYFPTVRGPVVFKGMVAQASRDIQVISETGS